ncbi:penicillin-insensitive murein endopeptidase [Aquibium sp. LZ166]|uniref:Penicillin-insensitive murein endopeptidase n=1 Tax=Aquibium pacificus TaxID=3153579 RepID=A0ABV3SF41_9HYPH
MRSLRYLAVLGGLLLPLIAGYAAAAEPLAKTLFGSKTLPSATAPQSFGFYSKGCLAGGVAIAVDGPHWQAMRVSRNRRWGHPAMITLLEKLSREAAQDGWPGLLLGDISQPRGGPMLTGHASHQIGLDADIWFTPMPNRRFTTNERENVGARSLIKDGSLNVDDRLWTPAHAALLKRAAGYGEVERILVHPGIKKKLCDTVTGDRAWLEKVRPFWGHDSHFHIRIGCQPGSDGCKPQRDTTPGDGCDGSLAWWFTEEPWRPNKNPDAPKARDIMTLASLPRACRQVLEAPSPVSEAAVTVGGPRYVATMPATANAFLPTPPGREIPVPWPRPDP